MHRNYVSPAICPIRKCISYEQKCTKKETHINFNVQFNNNNKLIICMGYIQVSHTNTNSLYSEMRIMKLQAMNEYLTCIFNVHEHDTWISKGLHVPSVKIELGKKFIAYRGTVLFNKVLVKNVDMNCSIHIFKRNIKRVISQMWYVFYSIDLWAETTT